MNPILLTAWLACQALDGTTTAIALHRYGPGVESNPIMRKGHIPIRIGVNLGGLLAYRRTKARAIPVVLAISGCAAGGWNLRQLAR